MDARDAAISGNAGAADLKRDGLEATPSAACAKKPSMHLEEAKEMCPEGHELSESYRAQGLQSTPGGEST